MPDSDAVTPTSIPGNISSSSANIYRDRIYIIKDVILKLVEYNEMNQTALFSFCGLNLKKHKPIIDDLEKNGLIQKKAVSNGKRVVTMYKSTPEGIKFCKSILEPYENMFPRNKPQHDK
jgi:predicted transcriptional regulator